MVRTCSHPMPRTVPRVGVYPVIPKGECYYLHFADWETEAQRGADSHSWETAKVGFEIW